MAWERLDTIIARVMTRKCVVVLNSPTMKHVCYSVHRKINGTWVRRREPPLGPGMFWLTLPLSRWQAARVKRDAARCGLSLRAYLQAVIDYRLAHDDAEPGEALTVLAAAYERKLSIN
jgi:hypothetical protein